MKTILRVEKLEKYYGNGSTVVKALDNISFTVEEGEFVGIMGQSGSGKSTLLNCIGTIDNITTGKLLINGFDATRMKENQLDNFRQKELGYIFQEFNLIDILTVYENIALALTIQGESPSKIQDKVLIIAKHLHIEDCLKKYPNEISGGQRQRVATARALVKKPPLILADEPTGALDSKSSRLLLERLEHMNREWKTTILMVTHDFHIASFTNRIIFLKDGKIFTELLRGECSRKDFLRRIIEVITLLGGDVQDAY